MNSANSLRWSAAHCAKMLSYDRFIRGKRLKSQGAKSGHKMVIKYFPSKTLQEPLCCSCGGALSWRRTISEDNIHRRLLWMKESNYSTHSTFGGRHFRHVYGLTTRSELSRAMCRHRISRYSSHKNIASITSLGSKQKTCMTALVLLSVELLSSALTCQHILQRSIDFKLLWFLLFLLPLLVEVYQFQPSILNFRNKQTKLSSVCDLMNFNEI